MATTNPNDKNEPADRTATSIDHDALPTIEFDEYLWEIANGIADLRNRTYSSINGGDIFGDQSSREAHLVGVMGELAVAKYLGDLVPEDVTVLERYGDRGWDLTVDETRVDVKTSGTHLAVPDLIIPYRPQPTADAFILAHRVDERTIRLIGYASRDHVLSKSAQRHPGDSRNYIVPAHELALFQSEE